MLIRIKQQFEVYLRYAENFFLRLGPMTSFKVTQQGLMFFYILIQKKAVDKWCQG